MLEPYREKERNEQMVMLEVECRNTGQCLPDGARATLGKSQIKIFESSIPAVLDLVEKEPESVKRAEEHCEEEFRAYAMEKAQVTEFAKIPSEVIRKLRAEYPGSPSASFQTLYHRDMKPLISAKVVQTGMPSDQQNQRTRDTLGVIKEIAPHIEGMLAGALKQAFEAGRQSAQQQSQPQQQRGGR